MFHLNVSARTRTGHVELEQVLRNIYMIQQIFSKIELIQSVPSPKFHAVIKTVTVCAYTPLRCACACFRFNGLTCTAHGYITYVVSNMTS